ncbi:hypothetical protein F9L33_15400 [Amylibacter sp. SFDW26]|uniref:DnaA N-terminal domain-containing protein n=1 Tax=Amylibacter sp. SFDW26 TaxID=2652722 RepID=UPI0012618E5C|nr:DnaA N-terminal domain-containing protein [Amylibacter sp. SFDW26]KAB7610091.1 hypothetical protein F9L33_15400 [Amylibacter sp. SFDW26]
MLASKPVGREAATKKYDILSALMTYALAREKRTQKLVLRLMSLITTRYNWQRDELSMGQKEIAKLWSVDERTVKRELAKLKSKGWLEVKRAGARGRVTLYSIKLEKVLYETQADWQKMGPDFVLRLTEITAPAAQNVHETNIVPFSAANHKRPEEDGSVWASASAFLFDQDTTVFAAWLRQLEEAGQEGGCLTLIAPTKFHATYVETHLADSILRTAMQVDPSIRSIRIST